MPAADENTLIEQRAPKKKKSTSKNK